MFDTRRLVSHPESSFILMKLCLSGLSSVVQPVSDGAELSVSRIDLPPLRERSEDVAMGTVAPPDK